MKDDIWNRTRRRTIENMKNIISAKQKRAGRLSCGDCARHHLVTYLSLARTVPLNRPINHIRVKNYTWPYRIPLALYLYLPPILRPISQIRVLRLKTRITIYTWICRIPLALCAWIAWDPLCRRRSCPWEGARGSDTATRPLATGPAYCSHGNNER